MKKTNSLIKIEKEIIQPPVFNGVCINTDLWQCFCGKWRTMDEQCVHLKQEDKIIDSRKEEIQ